MNSTLLSLSSFGLEHHADTVGVPGSSPGETTKKRTCGRVDIGAGLQNLIRWIVPNRVLDETVYWLA